MDLIQKVLIKVLPPVNCTSNGCLIELISYKTEGRHTVRDMLQPQFSWGGIPVFAESFCYGETICPHTLLHEIQLG